MCPQVLTEGGIQNIKDLAPDNNQQYTIREDFEAKINALSGDALRCISFAYFEM